VKPDASQHCRHVFEARNFAAAIKKGAAKSALGNALLPYSGPITAKPSTGGVMPADVPGSWGHRDARRLRASAPHAKPLVPTLTRPKREALIAGLFRCAVKHISPGWGRSQ
jgi:hypothetical protein